MRFRNPLVNALFCENAFRVFYKAGELLCKLFGKNPENKTRPEFCFVKVVFCKARPGPRGLFWGEFCGPRKHGPQRSPVPGTGTAVGSTGSSTVLVLGVHVYLDFGACRRIGILYSMGILGVCIPACTTGSLFVAGIRVGPVCAYTSLAHYLVLVLQ